MAGNVWKRADDRYTGRHDDPCCAPQEPRDTAAAVPCNVVKGGSFLCADGYCRRYRPAARRPRRSAPGMSHIGFRCVDRSSRLP